MAQEILLYTKCTQCNGDGQFEIGSGQYQQTITCNWPGCVNGYIQCSKVTIDPGLDDITDKMDDLMDKLNDVKEKCDEIMEKLKED